MVSTDMVAGPTEELLIYADATADSQLIAVDLISQAEHSTDTVCGLVTTSDKLASEGTEASRLYSQKHHTVGYCEKEPRKQWFCYRL